MQKIRWKGGIVLFFVLAELLILKTFGSFVYLTKVEYFQYKAFDFIAIFIACVICVGLFLISLYISEKKILTNTYTRNWLLLRSILVVLGLYAIATLIFGCMFFMFTWPDASGLVLAFLTVQTLWIVPTTVGLFFFLPAVVLQRFYLKKEYLKGIFILFLVLVFVLPVFLTNTCYFLGPECAERRSVMTDNPLECEKISDDTDRGGCYYALMTTVSESGDIKNCNKFPEESKGGNQRDGCIMTFARKHDNPRICEEAANPKLCYKDLIVATYGGPTGCKNGLIQYPDLQQLCDEFYQ